MNWVYFYFVNKLFLVGRYWDFKWWPGLFSRLYQCMAHVSIWALVCMVFNAVFNSISVILRRPLHLSMFPGILLTSTPHNFLSKPLAAFPHNLCRNNGQRWERNESCRNGYHQSSERILVEPGIEPATSCSQVRNAADWAMGLGTTKHEIFRCRTFI